MQGTTAQVMRSDGTSGLLTAAADLLPSWLDRASDGGVEAIARNRIWIAYGHLHIVPRTVAPSGRRSKAAPPLTFDGGLAAVNDINTSTLAPIRIQEELKRTIFDEVPGKMHGCSARVRAVLPFYVASVLVKDTALAAAACRAYFSSSLAERSSVDKAAGFWPQEAAQGQAPADERLVTCTIKLNRFHCHGLLQHQLMHPQRGWAKPDVSTEGVRQHISAGIKLVYGLHLYARSLGVDVAAAAAGSQEAVGTLEDDLPEWRAYRARLERQGYFAGALEGSQAHTRRLEEAERAFKASPEGAAAAAQRQARVAALQVQLRERLGEDAVRLSATLPASDPECGAPSLATDGMPASLPHVCHAGPTAASLLQGSARLDRGRY